MRLVDDQHDLLALGVLLNEEHVQGVEQFDLTLIERLEAELRQHGLQELRRRQLRLRNDGVDDVILELVEKGL